MSLRRPSMDAVGRAGLAVVWSVALLTAPSVAAEGRGRLGVLETDGQRIPGWLVPSNVGSGLAWQPAGGGEPLPFGDTARIRFRGLDALGGVGLDCAADGGAWRIVNVDAEGPAGRDGRVREHDRLVSIAQGPHGRPLAVDGLDADEVRALLRGIVGTSVVVTVMSASGVEERIELVRDAQGRGELAGAAPRDVLDRVLAIHDAREPKAEAGGGPATVHLRWGDRFTATVVAADRDSLHVRVAADRELTVAAAHVRAIDLQPASGRPILKHKKDRLLTLPRIQQSDPPTHLVRLMSGDYVRGRLVAIDAEQVRLQIQAEEKPFPRDEVSRIIWLGLAGEPRPTPRAAVADLPGTPLQFVGTDGRRLTLAATGLDEERILGQSPALGDVRMPLVGCAEILVGAGIEAFGPAELPYENWVLKAAPEPRALAE